MTSLTELALMDIATRMLHTQNLKYTSQVLDLMSNEELLEFYVMVNGTEGHPKAFSALSALLKRGLL